MRINQRWDFVRKTNFIKKIYKNQSKKLLQNNLIRIIIIKFKNLNSLMFLLLKSILNTKKSDL